MKKLASYLKEYARITLAVIKTPRKFFEEIKSEDETDSESFAYLLVSNTIFIAGTLLGLLFSGAPPILLLVIFLFASIAILYVLLAIVFSTIYSAVLHLAVFMVKGKGKFHQTFKVICYSASPINFAGLFIFVTVMAFFRGSLTGLSTVILLGLFISMLYMFYIVVVGISVTSDISGSRAFAALMIQILIFAIIPILAYAPVFFQQYDTSTTPAYSPIPSTIPTYENYTPPNPEKYRITAYAGSPPQIDGIIDYEDRWSEGEETIIESGGQYYAVTTKHDFEHIYVLLEWGAPIEEINNIAISFEQDDGKPDFNLSNGRVDSYYQGYYKDGKFVISDTHYDSDYTYKYTDKEHQDGSLKGSYKNGKWTLEWKLPMNSGDKYDIYVNKYPAELGFSIIDTVITPGGIFPPDATDYDPRTWGTMTIVDKKRQ